jgi:hypothetical protein
MLGERWGNVGGTLGNVVGVVARVGGCDDELCLHGRCWDSNLLG